MRPSNIMLIVLLAAHAILAIVCAVLLRDAETAGAVALWSILLVLHMLSGYRVAAHLGESLQ